MDLNKIFKDSNPEDLQKLITLLQAMVDSSDSTQDHDDDSEEDQPMKTRSRKMAKSVSKNRNNNQNKFLNMQEMNMHKEDTEFQKKVSKHPPVPRSRDFEPLIVKCRVCGKSEKINPALVDSTERYKCNNCATSAG